MGEGGRRYGAAADKKAPPAELACVRRMRQRHIYGTKVMLDSHRALRRIAGTRRPAKSPARLPAKSPMKSLAKSMGMTRESRLTPTPEGYSFVP
jgi:hypothetical protein